MDVLNYKTARSDKDERHICPLQLGLIERCVQIWSLPDEVIFSPFAGICSEGVGAIRQGRKFVGIELKPEYFRDGKAHLKRAEKQLAVKETPLFAH
jgi:DNA modification methylase